ncbi:protein adenylyltransferase SelO [Occallatibacter savannae]|uniref:protein adenylyltransferase SelO n=1 Tax=Occallatibacter savannae TaxID=1002691 RepID=UPI001EF6F678|nr:YdiU family protein [Occallatibacter savannae]
MSPSSSTADRHTAHFRFENTYSRLPERFYARLNPTPVAVPRLVKLNTELARTLGIDPRELASDHGVEILAGNRVADGSEPLAQAYAGHQFGYFVPQLGDGRANLLGELVGRDGLGYDIQLKGSGRTPFSRGGDGRAALGPVLREYIVSEAMAALGVPTTRALAAVTTGERVQREIALPGAVLTRVARSHLRVGTFQYFAARRDTDGLRILADFAIARHYPDAAKAERPYRALLDGVIGRQAELVAQWMLLGFIHGVMNTDNTSISGETIDYGPCAFMEAYDPATVFSAIDQQGRYAYGNQPRVMLWNLTRLAEALLPLLEEEEGSEQAALRSANEALAAFAPKYEVARLDGFRHKLGLFTEREDDALMVERLLELMFANHTDLTLGFRRLCGAALGPEGDEEVRSLFADAGGFDSWLVDWRKRLKEEPHSPHERARSMRMANPAFIPRNHLVEAALKAASEHQDYQPFEELLDVISRPYEERPSLERYTMPARAEERVSQTFCGT